MSSAGRTKLAFIKEAVFGEAPASPDMKSVPYNTGDAFANARDTLTSGRVQSVRAPRQTRLGTNAPEKGITAELVWQTFDELLAAGMGDQWMGGASVDALVTIAAATLTLDSGDWSDAVYFDAGIQVGAVILVDDDGTLKAVYVSAISGNVMTVQELDQSSSPALTVASSVTKTLIVGAYGKQLTTSVTDTIIFSASGLTVTLAGTLTWDGFKVGDNIWLDGTVSNDGWHKIEAINGLVVTLAAAPTDETINTAVTVDIMTDRGSVGNGNTLPSFTMEEQFLDHRTGAGNYRSVNGVKVSNLSFSMQPSAFVELSLTLMGAKIGAFVDSTIAGSIVDPDDQEGFDTFTGAFLLGGIAGCVSGFDVALNNSNSRNFCLFERDANAMTDGIPEMTGNINAFFDDREYSNAYFDETPFAPFVRMVDSDGNAYAIDIATAKFTGDTISIGDIDVTEALPFSIQPNANGNELVLMRQPAAR